MTRKQALFIALKDTNNREAKQVIQNMIENMPFHEWDKATIFDAVDQFIVDNGRTPTALDFKTCSSLPSGATVQYRMKMLLSEFLKKYYPKRSNSIKYYNKSTEELLTIFRDVYKNIYPKTANVYNKLRPKDTPTWWTIAHVVGFTKWSELIDYLGIEKPEKNISPRVHAKTDFTVVSHSDLEI